MLEFGTEMTVSSHLDPATFRDALGRFATGVTVITVESQGTAHGMTANGFMSVSLDPFLVLVSVAKAARMHRLLESAEGYGVSVLGHDQRDLSLHLSGRPLEGIEVPLDFVDDVPLLENALVRIATRIVDSHSAGDHTLFIARVLQLDVRDGQPLIFHSGAYTKLHVPRIEVRREGDWADFSIEPHDPLAG